MKVSDKQLALGALLVAGLTAVVPVLWIAGVLTVPMAMILSRSRWRWVIGAVGLPLVIFSFARFVFQDAPRGFAFADRQEDEKNAVSRLREIYWAESQAHRFKLVDRNNDGVGEYLSFPELLGEKHSRLPGSPPLLKADLYALADGSRGIFQSQGYDFIIYLPGQNGLPTTRADEADPVASGRAFVAYAWPADPKHGGHRAYFVDQYEQVCETDNTEAFYGLGNIPAPSAYALNASSGVSFCGRDDDPGSWRPLVSHGRAKEPRAQR